MSDQKTIDDAVNFLYTHGKKYAEAKAHRVYIEEYRKSLKAMLMKKAQAEGLAKTAAGAEIEAYSDSAYIELLQGLKAAVEKEEELRFALESARARIDCWRSEQANNRFLDKVTM